MKPLIILAALSALLVVLYAVLRWREHKKAQRFRERYPNADIHLQLLRELLK